MTATPARILVLYGTSEGHTARIASALAETLRSLAMDVHVANAAEAAPPADRFDAVIVAASVHAGAYQRAVVRWVRENREALNTRRTAFVSVCLAVLSRDPATQRDLRDRLRAWLSEVGWAPAETKIVAGALPYTRYPWWKRYLMRRIVAREHGDVDTRRDYEYTDWTDLDAFGRAFVDHLANDAGERRAG